MKQTSASGSKVTSKSTTGGPEMPVIIPPVQKPGVPRNSFFPLPWDKEGIGPPEATHYLPIPLRGKTPAKPVTGVYLPNGFTYIKPEVDVILFFHGNQRGDKDFPGGWKFDTIFEYWQGNFPKGSKGSKSTVQFRDDLNAAGKHSVVLIAPTLGVFPGAAGGGDQFGLFNTEAADAPGGYIAQVFEKLAEQEPKAKGITKARRIILAGHSGGGNPVLRQLELIKDTEICEVWAFEAIYVPVDTWYNAVRSNPSTEFFFHYATIEQKSKAEQIREKFAGPPINGKSGPRMGGQLNDRYIEHPAAATEDHYGALTKNFFDRVSNSTCIK
jgi:hypothetical protein